MKRVSCMFVPGVKGTELWCERCEKRSWPPNFIKHNIDVLVRTILGGFSMRLEDLMRDDEYECLRNHEKKPKRVIDRVHISTCGVCTREVYAPFLERLKRDVAECCDENIDINVTTFPYDWTRSNVETARKLYHELLTIANTCDKIILIAHSMGGLVCRYMLENLLNGGDEKENDTSRHRIAAKIELFYGVAVPHYGCVKPLHHLIDPDGGSFSEFCRHIVSLYEMIPFLSLCAIVEGFEAIFNKLRRRRSKQSSLENEITRSDMFLCDENEIVIDPVFWRLPRTCDEVFFANDDYKMCLVDAITTRFPVLKDHADKLYRALDFHLSLNTDRKPTQCIYIFVNATGVISPSSIDKNGRLIRHSSNGDGTVCFTRRRRWPTGFKEKIRKTMFPKSDARTVVVNNRETMFPDTNNKHAYIENVHISMLNHVDLLTPIRNIVRSHLPDSINWNVKNIVWDLIGTGKKKGLFSGIFQRVRSDKPDLTVASAYSWSLSETYRVDVRNLNTGHCTVTFHSVNGGDEWLKLVLEKHVKEGRNKTKSVRIKYRTLGFGVFRLILTGTYEPVSFETDDGHF